ncbi:transposase [Acidithrix ferrooxidans]|uniref:transposase n=1 Tax=Acidithrix ferrooxidans TaxID=1280514 RepID=UPI001269B842
MQDTKLAHRVIDSGRNVPEVASELSISQEALYRWVKDERIRLEAASSVNEGPLNLLTIRDTTLPKSKENGSHGRIASKRGNAS